MYVILNAIILHWWGLTYRHGSVWDEHITASGKYCFSKIKPIICSKARKHNSTKFLVQKKWNSITDAMSQAIQNENILPAEFHNLLHQME